MGSWALVRMRWEDVDRHAILWRMARICLVVGALIAVFGLPPVPLHSPLRFFGMVCPLCGGTRAVQDVFRGDFAMAWRYNPIAFPVVAGAIGTLARHAVGIATGRWLNVSLVRPRLSYALFGLAMAVLWINQIQHRHMLTREDGGVTQQIIGLAAAVAVTGAGCVAHHYFTRWQRARTAPAGGLPGTGSGDVPRGVPGKVG